MSSVIPYSASLKKGSFDVNIGFDKRNCLVVKVKEGDLSFAYVIVRAPFQQLTAEQIAKLKIASFGLHVTRLAPDGVVVEILQQLRGGGWFGCCSRRKKEEQYQPLPKPAEAAAKREADEKKDERRLPAITHKEPINCLSTSFDGEWLATSSDTTLCLWSLHKEGVVKTFKGHADRVSACAFSPDKEILGVGCRDGGGAYIWDMGKEKILHQMAGKEGTIAACTFLAGKPLFILAESGTGLGGTVSFWNTESGNRVSFITSINVSSKFRFSQDGALFATSSRDKPHVVYLWQTQGKERTAFDYHVKDVCSIAFSPDAQRVAIASWDNTVTIWKEKERQLTFGINPESVLKHSKEEYVTFCTFSADGKLLLTAYDSGTILVHDISSHQVICSVKEQVDPEDYSFHFRAVFLPGRDIVAYNRPNNTIRFLNYA